MTILPSTTPVVFQGWILTIVLCFGSSHGSATLTVNQKSDQMTELIEVGLKRSFVLRSQAYKYQNSVDQKKDAFVSFLPAVSLEAAHSNSLTNRFDPAQDESGSSHANSLSVSGAWTLWDNGNSVYSAIRASRAQRIEELNNRAAIRDYVSRVIDSYVSYQLILSDIKIGSAYLEQSQWAEKEARLLVRTGVKTKLDVIEAEIQVRTAERDLERLRTQRETAELNLKFLLNQEQLPELTEIDLLTYEPYFARDFQAEWKRIKSEDNAKLMMESLEYRKSQLELEQAGSTYSQAKWNYFPSAKINLSKSWDLTKNYLAEPQTNPKTLESTTLALNLSWNLWDWFLTSRSIHRSERDFRMSEIQFHEQKFRKITQLAGLKENYSSLLKNIDTGQLILAKAEEQMIFSKELFKLGKIIMLKMQQSNLTYAQARRSQAELIKSKLLLQVAFLSELDLNLIPAKLGTFDLSSQPDSEEGNTQQELKAK